MAFNFLLFSPEVNFRIVGRQVILRGLRQLERLPLLRFPRHIVVLAFLIIMMFTFVVMINVIVIMSIQEDAAAIKNSS